MDLFVVFSTKAFANEIDAFIPCMCLASTPVQTGQLDPISTYYHRPHFYRQRPRGYVYGCLIACDRTGGGGVEDVGTIGFRCTEIGFTVKSAMHEHPSLLPHRCFSGGSTQYTSDLLRLRGVYCGGQT
eukprot:scaffold141997_cov27-Prasinocladus_malaysianus.AAC.1